MARTPLASLLQDAVAEAALEARRSDESRASCLRRGAVAGIGLTALGRFAPRRRRWRCGADGS